MEGKNKYGNTGFQGFLRYIGNNLSGTEKNSFERELQKDPFAEEAEEGLSSLSGDVLKNDMQSLSGRLKIRTSRGRRIIMYRIAASVAVLMTISTVYMLLRKSEEIKPAIEQPVAFEINRSEPIKAVKDEEMTKQINIHEKHENSIRKASVVPVPSVHIAQNIVIDTIRDGSKNKLIISPAEITQSDIPETTLAPPASRSLSATNTTRVIRGRIISSDDHSPIPGATIVIKGTTNGTITDSNGNFELTVPGKSDAPLIASYIGMTTQEVRISNDSLLSVSLSPESKTLSEVVVTGYGSGSRSRNLGAAAGGAERSIDKKEAIKTDYTHPEPENGKKNFDDYIEKNIRRPDILKEGDKAIVVLSFIVRISGIPDSIHIVRSQGDAFSKEAIRLIKEGPNWKPATENGKAIEEEARVRIVFK